MKKKILPFLVLILLFMGGCGQSTAKVDENFVTEQSEMIPQTLTTSMDDMTALAENISPAIVGISCTIVGGESLGSGVCVGSGGFVLTNQHVIDSGNNIKLHLFNGSTASAILLWQDSSLDIAILKSSVSLPYLPLGNTDSCLVGQDILAVGTPINLQFNHTFTRGIISALNRTLLVSNKEGNTYMQNLIQHDASLNPGNSGGPLINKYGEIIGINTLKISDGEGMGFAIPTKSIQSIIDKVFVLEKDYVTPYLGMFGYDTAIANYYEKTDAESGVYILDVADGSPAFKSGLQEGDIILSVDGKEVIDMLDLRDIVFKKECYDKLELRVIRGGKEYGCSLVLEPHPVTN